MRVLCATSSFCSRVLLTACGCIAFAVPVLSQDVATANASAGVLHGIVLDPTRAPVPGARIHAVVDGVRNYDTVSDLQGEFSLKVSGTTCALSISAGGFMDSDRTVRIAEPAEKPYEFLMQVAAMREALTITEAADENAPVIRSATKTLTPLRDVPQSITVVSQQLIKDQVMMSIGDVVRYVPGVTAIQGENNRDQVVIRGNSSSADFFLNGLRDDVQYYRDLYNLDRVEALKGPNAMIFGRGGGGGVINRVSKEAGFTPIREISVFGGSFGDKRFAFDFDQPLSSAFALRLNAMYEDAGSFRDYVGLARRGVSPSLTWTAGSGTKITFGYENFRDDRVADRGIPSYQGRPAPVDIATYFGNPDESHVGARVNLGSINLDQQLGGVLLSNHLLIGDYDRGYQNFVPGVLSSDGTQVSMSGYNNATRRRNLLNQTDATFTAHTGAVRHTLLAGTEVGRQMTDNFRNTAYFNNNATSFWTPLSNSAFDIPTTFRQSATDANNHLVANITAGYMQDQVQLTQKIQLIAGLRFDHFGLQYTNLRNNDALQRIDNLLSPRAGIVYKPAALVSLYANYSVSYLPSSGDQFSSLTTITQQVKPERFRNLEAGIKWDIARYLSLTTAVYRLDRTNTRSTDPNDPTRIVQTGSQRSNGFETGLNGSITRAWRVSGGYAYQDAFVTSATVTARQGAQVPQVPHHSFALWNQYQVLPRLGAGLGVLNRTDMFAAIDNTVLLPGYTRADAAVYYSITEKVRLQANVENLFNRRYYLNADNNTNISPGSPRAVRVGLIARF